MAQADSARSGSLTFERVLEEEHRFLDNAPPPGSADSTDRGNIEHTRPADLSAREADGHSALCLSGGGIRSASFNLGLLQGLAQAGLLDSFDYLSTVSGGGYIGGWLSAWRTRARQRIAPDSARLLAVPSPADQSRDSDPLSRLRLNVRFLDPHVGLRSIDVWTLATIILRNLLLNWVVLVPLLAAAALLPRLYLGVLGLPSQPELVAGTTLAAWYYHDWLVCLPLFGIAALYAALELPSLGNRRNGQRGFHVCFLAPVVLGEIVISVHRFWAWRFEGGFSLRNSVIIGTAGMILPWILGGVLSARWFRPWTWIAAATAGAVGRSAIWLANHELTEMARHHPQIFASVDVPLTLVLLFAQMTLFVGLASRDMTDDDREWWGRAAAWVLMVAVVWLVAGSLVIYAPVLLSKTFSAAGVSEEAGRLWLGLLTLGTGAAASSLGSSWTRVSTRKQWVERWLFVLAAPVLVLLLMLLLATADLRLLEFFHDLNLFNELTKHPVGASLPEDLMALGLLLLIGTVLSRPISVNDFSLHGMYRDAARADLPRHVASAGRRGIRTRSRVSTTRTTCRSHETAAAGRPLHVVNATLNLVAQTSLAMQERRSESFTMTALHCGSARAGYRPSDAYVGGISLGQCIDALGAAVSPNMGAASKPALTFLLTLFNARLGAWIANPGPAGDSVWLRPRLSYGAAPLLERADRTGPPTPARTCTCRTAGTSRTWASTRWSGAGAA